jgi:hypothetical protein
MDDERQKVNLPNSVPELVETINKKGELLLHSSTPTSMTVQGKDFQEEFNASNIDIKSFLMGLFLGCLIHDLRKEKENSNDQSSD